MFSIGLFLENIKKSKKIFCFLLFILLVSGLCCKKTFKTNNCLAQDEKDAVAVRVIPNPEHKSPSTWYKEEGFSGSPQSTRVDGYEAIIDGRTVYVNVGNIVSNELYTNIYLISYNQNAGDVTNEIFSRLVKAWKFNSNIAPQGTCMEDVNKNCTSNNDCDVLDFCLGPKARIVRDVKRLSDLYDMNKVISSFHEEYGRFPRLDSGSYKKGISISNWPSWKKVLSQSLNFDLPVDPINKLGPCVDSNTGLVDERFLEATCWDNEALEFADRDNLNSSFDLPSQSKAYVYESINDGIEYTLCAVMESGYVTGLQNGACDGSETYALDDQHINRPPVIIHSAGDEDVYSGTEYEHYVEAYDPDNDELEWTFDTTIQPWVGWSGAPELFDSPDKDEKIFFASQVGDSGVYFYTVTVDDGRGGTATETITVRAINGNAPVITRVLDSSGTVLYDVDTGLTGPFNVSGVVIGTGLGLRVEGEEADSQYPLSFEFVGFSSTFEEAADIDGNTLSYSNEPITLPTGLHNASLFVYDAYRGRSTEPVEFSVEIVNNPPTINSPNAASAVGCTDYSFQISAIDPDGHDLNYRFVNSALVSLVNAMLNEDTGLCEATPIIIPPGSYNFDLSVRDEYYSDTTPTSSAEAIQNFTFTVVDENYDIDNVFNQVIYNHPGEAGVANGDYYHPFTYIQTFGTNAAYPDDIIWAATSVPANFSISTSTGVANWTPDAIQAGQTHAITIEARNRCRVLRNEYYDLTVLQNEWCGDYIVQGVFGEQCENNCVNCQAVCTPGFVSCSGSAADADGCECPLPGNGSEFEYCYEDASDTGIKLYLNGDYFTDRSNFRHTVNSSGASVSAVSFSGLGYSFGFDGTNDFLRIPDSDDWDVLNGDFSIDAWVRLDRLDQVQMIFYQGNSNAPDWAFFFDPINGLSFCARQDSSTSWFNNCSDFREGGVDNWAVDEWTHVAVAREGNRFGLLKDGAWVDRIGFSGTLMPNVSADLFVGADSINGRNLSGFIDDIRVSKGTALWSLDDFSIVYYNGSSGGYCVNSFTSSWYCD